MSNIGETKPLLVGGILTGGKSSRMKRPKAELQLPCGKTLLEHAYQCLEPHCSNVLVSCSDEMRFDQLLPGLAREIDSSPFQGPISGIVTLLHQAIRQSKSAVLVLPVDLPALSANDLQPLVDAFARAPDSIVTATFDGTHDEPLVAIYPTNYLIALQHLASSDDRSVSRWLSRNDHTSEKLHAEAGKSVNTPEQWQEYNERIANTG